MAKAAWPEDSLGDMLEDSLPDALGVAEVLGLADRAGLGDGLSELLNDSLGEPLEDSLGDWLAESLEDSLGDAIGDLLVTSNDWYFLLEMGFSNPTRPHSDTILCKNKIEKKLI